MNDSTQLQNLFGCYLFRIITADDGSCDLFLLQVATKDLLQLHGKEFHCATKSAK
ncbi:hypothetical protein R6Q59_020329 [Mikania micrantha]